jgi:phospholipid/cholesterol/gamma-HCH transport system substrate-binding protein
LKFRIRYADQLVGLFIVVAILSIIILLFLLGSKQNWFAKNYAFKTYTSTASGLSKNMSVTYKGFTIGAVKNFKLTDDDRVEVIFTVLGKYKDQARQGSLVEIMISPIGLGNQFLFYPGLGSAMLKENELVPLASSEEGQALIAQGLGFAPGHDDSIAILMARVNLLLDEINRAIEGDEETTLGRSLLSVEETLSSLPGVVGAVDTSLTPILEDLETIIGAFSTELSNPNGLLRIVSEDSEVLSGLESSVTSLAENLSNLEKTTAYLPREMPQVSSLLSEAQTTLLTVQDVLVAVRNNPLLKNGVPDRVETESSGTNPRNIEF